MKKLLLIAALIAFNLTAMAQNIQFHYDFGRLIYDELDKTEQSAGRPTLTTTVEMFRPDKIGSTFYFVDIDYSNGVTGAYWEIARELCFWQQSKWNWLSLHVEYNGGMSKAAGSFNDAWLLGATYSGHSADYSKTWSLSAMYKNIPGTFDTKGKKQEHNFQITGVWGINFAKGWSTYSGFADFWREHRAWQDTEYIFLSEHQLWLNLNKLNGWKDYNLSVGTEIEFSNNFVDKGFYVIPTLAVKWTFN